MASEKTSPIVKVGLVGQGLVGPSHFKGYASHPNAEVVAVCDISQERAETFAVEHSITQVYTSYDEMLANADINTVDIATPTHLHIPMTQRAAEAGKHIHCEKPFCRSIAEGQVAVDAVKKAGVKLVVGETYVFNTSHMKARELIEAGEIGNPLQIRQRHGPWRRRQRGTPVRRSAGAKTWRRDPELSGGGNYTWIFDHAVHFFAAAEYFLLDQQISEVYSVKSTCTVREKREDEIPIITWTYENTDCQGVWMRAEPANGKYDFMHGFNTQIIGEKGMIEVLGEGGHNLICNGDQQHLVLHREGKETQCFRFDEGGDDIWNSEISYYGRGHINQVHHLIDSIVNDTVPRYGGEDGIHAIHCTLAAIRSAEETRPIQLVDIDPSYTAY
jgi:predicted dehydrogenase